MTIAEHAQISGIDTCVSSGKFDEFRLEIKSAIRKDPSYKSKMKSYMKRQKGWKETLVFDV